MFLGEVVVGYLSNNDPLAPPRIKEKVKASIMFIGING